MRGSLIIVRDYSGNALLRRIWEVSDCGVLVTTDDLFDRLENGDRSIFAISFPLDDCFFYDASEKQQHGQHIDFNRLTKFAP